MESPAASSHLTAGSFTGRATRIFSLFRFPYSPANTHPDQPVGVAKAATRTSALTAFHIEILPILFIEKPGQGRGSSFRYATWALHLPLYKLYCFCSETMEKSGLIYTTPVIKFLLLSNFGWKLGLKVRKILSVSWSESFLLQDSYKWSCTLIPQEKCIHVGLR